MNKLKTLLFPKDDKSIENNSNTIVVWAFVFELTALLVEAAGSFEGAMVRAITLLGIPFALAFIYKLINNRINNK